MVVMYFAQLFYRFDIKNKKGRGKNNCGIWLGGQVMTAFEWEMAFMLPAE